MVRKIAIGLGGLIGLVVVVVLLFAGYASATAPGKLNGFADAPAPQITASTDPAVIERGRYLVRGPAHCAQCHGLPDREHPEKNTPDVPLSGGLEFAMGPIATTWSANLTPDKATGIGRRTDAELARTIRTGVLADGSLSFMMRFSAAGLSDDDLTAVISYLRSLPPVQHDVKTGTWGTLGHMLITAGVFPVNARDVAGPVGVPAGPEPSVERGRYLATTVMACTECHSKVDMKTFKAVEPFGSGSDPDPSHGSDSDMEFVAPNLTSDPTGITGKLTEDQFIQRIRAGRVYKSSIMPWEAFGQTSDDDLRSVYRFLKSLPPVANDVGATYRKRS